VAELHLELLEQARHLARREPRRPRQASLRRAVSAAYYAVFHALAAEFGRSFRVPVRQAAGRLIGRSSAKEVAKTIASSRSVLHALGGTTCPNNLRQIADDFVRLQKARHDADYDLSFRFTRPDTLGHIQRAERAVDAIAAARKVCPDELQAFLLALIGGVRFHARLKP
jgi:uncharacterized protein (UPF0332 family)